MHLRSVRALALVLSSLSVLGAETNAKSSREQPPELPTRASLYGRAQNAAQTLYADLQSFICTENVQRFRQADDGRTTMSLGTLSSRLSFENGVERYTDISENGKVLSRMSELDGAWSNGDYGSLILETAALMRSAKPAYSRFDDVAGVLALVFAFEVPAQASPWDLQVGDTHFKLPFHVDVWVSQSTGQILKITRSSTAIPDGTGIYQVVWDLTLGPVDLNGRTWVLPQSGEYVVSYGTSSRQDSNLLTFSDYHRYDAQSVIRFMDFQ